MDIFNGRKQLSLMGIRWHKDIPHPVTVRYGWDDNPVHANLKNRTGLPASPFQISLEDK